MPIPSRKTSGVLIATIVGWHVGEYKGGVYRHTISADFTEGSDVALGKKHGTDAPGGDGK